MGLTQRKEHCRLLSERLNRLGKAPLILSGEVGKQQRTTIIETIQNAPSDKEMLVIATESISVKDSTVRASIHSFLLSRFLSRESRSIRRQSVT